MTSYRVKRHDDEQPQNWLSTSRVVIEWVRRAIQTAAMKFPTLDDTIGLEFQAYRAVPYATLQSTLLTKQVRTRGRRQRNRA